MPVTSTLEIQEHLWRGALSSISFSCNVVSKVGNDTGRANVTGTKLMPWLWLCPAFFDSHLQVWQVTGHARHSYAKFAEYLTTYIPVEHRTWPV